mmetsp:Transcript_23793/g.51731  ORF Transcript_23793/g.51731 Transcript_23793/m.51731 type:complete len:125 (-) Transcript_23793:73-447(-)
MAQLEKGCDTLAQTSQTASDSPQLPMKLSVCTLLHAEPQNFARPGSRSGCNAAYMTLARQAAAGLRETAVKLGWSSSLEVKLKVLTWKDFCRRFWCRHLDPYTWGGGTEDYAAASACGNWGTPW